MKKIASLGLLVLGFIAADNVWASADEWGGLFTGDIYLAGTNRGELLFRQTNSIEHKGDLTILRHTYAKPDGSPATVEEVTLKDGEIVDYYVDFATNDCGCRLERSGDKVKFSFFRGDTSRTGERAYVPTLVTGPMLNGFILKNWDALVKGETVYFHFPAMPLQRIVRFKLSRNDGSPHARNGAVVLKMDIANFFIRLFVDPVDLVFDMPTRRLAEIHGKSLLEREVNGKIENPVVSIYYRYEK